MSQNLMHYVIATLYSRKPEIIFRTYGQFETPGVIFFCSTMYQQLQRQKRNQATRAERPAGRETERRFSNSFAVPPPLWKDTRGSVSRGRNRHTFLPAKCLTDELGPRKRFSASFLVPAVVPH